MDTNMALSEQLEDYLEAISELAGDAGVARVGDIAQRLHVHKSTVTAALHRLADKGLIAYSPYTRPSLTAQGRQTARAISERHAVLQRFFRDVLLLPQDKAADTACRLEHVMEQDTLNRLYRFQEFIEQCPRGGVKWIRGFRHYCEEGAPNDNCERCMELCLEEYRTNKKQEPHDGEEEQEASKVRTLKDLQPGAVASVRRITNTGRSRRRLLDMGLVPGTRVEMIKVAPLGDPIEIKAKGYNLSIRKDEADKILMSDE